MQRYSQDMYLGRTQEARTLPPSLSLLATAHDTRKERARLGHGMGAIMAMAASQTAHVTVLNKYIRR